MSTTAKMDSIAISSIIGIASKPSARPIGPTVKSVSLSLIDSATKARERCHNDWSWFVDS